MTKESNTRITAVNILLRLLQQQGSLASEINGFTKDFDEQEKRFVQELSYGTCRWYFYLENVLSNYVKKPLKAKDNDIKLLLLLGLYQLQFTRVPPYAAINETVDAAFFFRKQWAKGLINGVLRSFQREQKSVEDPATKNTVIYTNISKQSHPDWLQKTIGRIWPDQAEAIFAANNQHPPFTLRVNQNRMTVDDYLARCQQQLPGLETTKNRYSPVGITLDKPIDVTALQGFTDGIVSVQDEAAQLAPYLLDLQSGQRVLDACCAPGGKTCHIGEVQTDLKLLTALDLEERRLNRVYENLQRLSIDAKVICGDATHPQSWWDGQCFDRILLDAPCSATGVIRRHPDIKLLRTPQAVDTLAQLQISILEALWPLLLDGGILLYATCSILPQENTQIIEQFVVSHDNAEHSIIKAGWGIPQPFGRQLLPQPGGHDGFYYARLIKRNKGSDPALQIAKRIRQ
ncbi:16S rRNA (cytosine(967)-C(5))-methyltransferase [Candidatus Endobugula sertula]|uniref:16S rRNA (cytosine(967)-C(5))-methyltransferase n=1 Tax=Candidatus Endobugula sertula TaxID=62101 RepID=A0A1D2QNM3_9GAMM|nr:16S rRNA (cytosine(967)-C(5))-methyltransferase [Candidatus Endobugula sertula]